MVKLKELRLAELLVPWSKVEGGQVRRLTRTHRLRVGAGVVAAGALVGALALFRSFEPAPVALDRAASEAAASQARAVVARAAVARAANWSGAAANAASVVVGVERGTVQVWELPLRLLALLGAGQSLGERARARSTPRRAQCRGRRCRRHGFRHPRFQGSPAITCAVRCPRRRARRCGGAPGRGARACRANGGVRDGARPLCREVSALRARGVDPRGLP